MLHPRNCRGDGRAASRPCRPRGARPAFRRGTSAACAFRGRAVRAPAPSDSPQGPDAPSEAPASLIRSPLTARNSKNSRQSSGRARSSSFSSLRVSPFAFSSSGPSGASPLGIRTPGWDWTTGRRLRRRWRRGPRAPPEVFLAGRPSLRAPALGQTGRARRRARHQRDANRARPTARGRRSHGGTDVSENPRVVRPA